MTTLFWVYVTGVLVAFIYSTLILRDDEGRVMLTYILYSLIFSLLSWLMVFALFIGRSISMSRKEREMYSDPYVEDEEEE